MLLAVVAVVTTLLATLLTAVAPAAPAGAASADDPNDAFHTWSGSDAGLAALKRGAVIRSRTVTYSLQGLPLPITVVQLLYRTTDQLGRPTVNVTSVLKPPVALHPDRVVAYGSFYDSLNPLDGPSYAVSGGTSPGGNAVQAELALVAPFLLEGYSVVVADTQGRTADFAAGPEYARTTLDSLRAAIRSPETGIAPRPDIALLGYSGGAIATGWAAALAPSYAPELNRLIVGAAEGGVLVAPDNNLHYVSGSRVWAGVAPMALIGAGRAFELDLEPYLNAYGRRLFARLERASISEVLGAYPGLTWRQVAKSQYRRPEDIRVYVDAVNKLNMGQYRAPTVPMFIGQGAGGALEGTSSTRKGIGAGDGVMIAGDVRTLARQYCEAGTVVQYRQYPLSHFTTVATWLPEAIAWVEQRFAGLEAPSSCGSIPAGTSLAPVPRPRG